MEKALQAIEQLQGLFEEFKKTNDAQLAEIKKTGHGSADREEKLAKLNGAMDAIGKRIETLEAAKQRPATGEEQKPSDEIAKKSFVKFMRNGDGRMNDEERKALSADSNTDGGILVRPEISNRIITKQFETTPMRQLATVETIGSDALEILQDLDEAGASWVTERQTRSTSTTPQFHWGTIAVHELQAMPAATQKMLDDASFDVEGWLSNKVADKFSRTENTAFVVGTGVGQPRGFATYASGTSYGQIEQVTSGSSGAFTTDGVLGALYALKEKYAGNATFLTQRLSVSAIRKLKDSQNRYLWEPSLQAGRPDTIFGRPIMYANDMATIGANALAMAVGDFKQGYTIVDRMAVRVLRDPFTSKPNILFYSTKRVGGDVVDFEAIKLLKLA